MNLHSSGKGSPNVCNGANSGSSWFRINVGVSVSSLQRVTGMMRETRGKPKTQAQQTRTQTQNLAWCVLTTKESTKKWHFTSRFLFWQTQRSSFSQLLTAWIYHRVPSSLKRWSTLFSQETQDSGFLPPSNFSRIDSLLCERGFFPFFSSNDWGCSGSNGLECVKI